VSGASNRVVGDMAWVETALALFKLKKERVALSHVDMWCEKGQTSRFFYKLNKGDTQWQRKERTRKRRSS